MARRHDAGWRRAGEYRARRKSYTEYDRDAVHPARRKPARRRFRQHADAVAAESMEATGFRLETEASGADDQHHSFPGPARCVREDPEVSDARAQCRRAHRIDGQYMSERYADFYRRSIEDVDAFWTEQARFIDWQTPFER